jgi:hypothetical protein
LTLSYIDDRDDIFVDSSQYIDGDPVDLTPYLLIENLPPQQDLSAYQTVENDVHVNLILIENNQLTLSYIDDRDDIFVDSSQYIDGDPVDLTPCLLIENLPP